MGKFIQTKNGISLDINFDDVPTTRAQPNPHPASPLSSRHSKHLQNN